MFQEVFDEGVKLPNDAIVQVWKQVGPEDMIRVSKVLLSCYTLDRVVVVVGWGLVTRFTTRWHSSRTAAFLVQRTINGSLHLVGPAHRGSSARSCALHWSLYHKALQLKYSGLIYKAIGVTFPPKGCKWAIKSWKSSRSITTRQTMTIVRFLRFRI